MVILHIAVEDKTMDRAEPKKTVRNAETGWTGLRSTPVFSTVSAAAECEGAEMDNNFCLKAAAIIFLIS